MFRKLNGGKGAPLTRQRLAEADFKVARISRLADHGIGVRELLSYVVTGGRRRSLREGELSQATCEIMGWTLGVCRKAALREPTSLRGAHTLSESSRIVNSF